MTHAFQTLSKLDPPIPLEELTTQLAHVSHSYFSPFEALLDSHLGKFHKMVGMITSAER